MIRVFSFVNKELSNSLGTYHISQLKRFVISQPGQMRRATFSIARSPRHVLGGGQLNWSAAGSLRSTRGLHRAYYWQQKRVTASNEDCNLEDDFFIVKSTPRQCDQKWLFYSQVANFDKLVAVFYLYKNVATLENLWLQKRKEATFNEFLAKIP